MATTNTEWFRDQTSLLGELQRVHKSRSGPPSIPGYDDLRELQRGGQGVVYAGTQKSTRRKVGIKVLLDGAFASDVSRRRFEREIDLVASLRHPNIVSIYDCGMTPAPDQRLYFVMEYIEGVPLNEYTEAMRNAEANGLDHHRSVDNGDHLALDSVSGIDIDDNDMARPLLPLSHVTMQSVLRLFAVVCDAVNYAHQRGVIHRDLKPSNIRIDAEGRPHILDFGLAKVTVDEAVDASRRPMTSVAGQFIGSLPWASPEQADGQADKMDIRSDVYSLGVVLYQVLTGRFPYDVSGGVRRVLDNILSAEPLRPSAVHRVIDDEVETIVLKCLAKEPDRRYQSAGELARDIRAYLAGEPIQAKRDSAWYTMMKTLRRYRVTGSVAALFAVILASGILATKWQADQAEVARLRAESEADLAGRRFNEVRRLARFIVYDLYDRLAHLQDSRETCELVVNSTLEYFDHVNAEKVEDRELRTEIAAAYERLGDVLGNPTMTNLGQPARAVECYEKALNIRQRLLDSQPANVALIEGVEKTLAMIDRVCGSSQTTTNDAPAR